MSVSQEYQPRHTDDGGILWDEVLLAVILNNIIFCGLVGNTEPCSGTPTKYLCGLIEQVEGQTGPRSMKHTSTDSLDIRHFFSVVKIGETITTHNLIELLVSFLDPVRIIHAREDKDLESSGCL